jgi:hypothetical protein
MSILDYTNNLINEGYIFSDKNIAIDLDKFESGESKKMFIVGLSGSGKSTIGMGIAEDYNKKLYKLDHCFNLVRNKPDDDGGIYWDCILDKISSSEFEVVEGLAITNLFSDNLPIPKNILDPIRKYILKQPIIILGTSSTLSSLRATTRATKVGNSVEGGFLSTLISRGKINFGAAKTHLDDFRKKRIKLGGNIKEFDS